MPGLCGLLNHSLERSLRLVTPVSGLFIVSPPAHTPYFCAEFSYWGRCLHVIASFATLAAEGNSYDFDPTTSPKKSGKDPRLNQITMAAVTAEAHVYWGGYVCRRCRFGTCGNRLAALKSCTASQSRSRTALLSYWSVPPLAANQPCCGCWRGSRTSPPGRFQSATASSTMSSPRSATLRWCSRTMRSIRI